MKHIMIDIETLGTQSNSVITEIAAVIFDIETGKTGSSIHLFVDPQSCVDIGLKANMDTIMWWMEQDDSARKNFATPDKMRIESALSRLSAWIKVYCEDEVIPWGNSARFDLGLLSDAYNAVNRDIPWKFWNERCLRTLVSFKPSVKDFTSFTGTRHNAIDDCKHQIKYCVETYKSLNT